MERHANARTSSQPTEDHHLRLIFLPLQLQQNLMQSGQAHVSSHIIFFCSILLDPLSPMQTDIWPISAFWVSGALRRTFEGLDVIRIPTVRWIVVRTGGVAT